VQDGSDREGRQHRPSVVTGSGRDRGGTTPGGASSREGAGGEVRGVGPDGGADADDDRGDTGLQPERTSLAWRRTGLAAAAVAAAMLRLAVLREVPVVAATSAALVVLSVGAFVEGSIRHDERRRWFERDRSQVRVSLVARASVAAVIGVSAIGVLLVVAS